MKDRIAVSNIDGSVPRKERQFFSDAPDGTSLLVLANPSVPGIKGKAVFAVVQFEYTTRDQGMLHEPGWLPGQACLKLIACCFALTLMIALAAELLISITST